MTNSFHFTEEGFDVFTVNRLKTLQLFVAAKNLTHEFKLNIKSLTPDELQDILELKETGAIHLIIEDEDVSIFPTYTTWTILTWLQEHLTARLEIETFIPQDYHLLAQLRTQSYA